MENVRQLFPVNIKYLQNDHNQTSIKACSSVGLSIHDGKLIIEPLNQEEYNFKALISEVKESNLHTEYFNDKPRGREIW